MKVFLSNLVLFISASLVILLPSILNGYPILYSDTGTYIMSGMESTVPIDRPVFYGLFLRVSSMWISLWYTAITQALLVTFFIVLLCKHIFRSRYVFRDSFIILAILSVTTSLAYFTNHIVPDIFTPMVIIGIVIILARPRLPVWLIITLLVLMVIFNLAHFSNLLLTTSLSLVACVAGGIFMKKKWVRERAMALVFLGILTLSSWILLPTVNHILGAGFVISRAKNIFMMGNLIENGLMKSYLEENCGKKNYNLCNYLEDLTDNSDIFIWEYDSPLYDGDCMDVTWVDCWLEKDVEYGIIIDDLLATPKYLRQFILLSIKSSFKQIVSYEIMGRRPEGEDSPVNYPMKKHLSRDYGRYISAKQQHKQLEFKVLSLSQQIIVPIAFVFLVLCNLTPGIRKKIPLEWRIITIGIVFALVANAFVCATFSHSIPRYQSRVIWLIPMLAIIYILNYKTIGLNLLIKKRSSGV